MTTTATISVELELQITGRIADDLTDLDSGDQPMFDNLADDLITLSEALDMAVEAADDITLITEW